MKLPGNVTHSASMEYSFFMKITCYSVCDLCLEFFVSNFRRVLSVVLFLLGDSSALHADVSEHPVCFILMGGVRWKNNQDKILVVFIWEDV